MQTNLNRYLAASDALEILEANRKEGFAVNLEQLLDTQRRLSEAQSKYFLSSVEYTVATKNVQFEKGTLLHTANLMIVDDPARQSSLQEPALLESPVLPESGTPQAEPSEPAKP